MRFVRSLCVAVCLFVPAVAFAQVADGTTAVGAAYNKAWNAGQEASFQRDITVTSRGDVMAFDAATFGLVLLANPLLTTGQQDEILDAMMLHVVSVGAGNSNYSQGLLLALSGDAAWQLGMTWIVGTTSYAEAMAIGCFDLAATKYSSARSKLITANQFYWDALSAEATLRRIDQEMNNTQIPQLPPLGDVFP